MRNLPPLLMVFGVFLVGSVDVYSSEVKLTSNIELITEKEQKELAEINGKYNYDARYRALNNEMSSHSARVWQYVNKNNDYDEMVAYLTKKVVAIELTEDESNNIEDLVKAINEKNRLEKELSDYQDLNVSYETIKAKYSDLENEKKKTNSEKLKLLDKIIERIKADINRQNIKGIYSGDINCSRNSTISHCLSQKREEIEHLIMDSHLFLGKNSTFRYYDVASASLNMKGRLTFEVRFGAVPVFSNKIYHELNEALGFKSIRVLLKSDVAAKWYVDGRYVGRGERVEVDLSSGSHGILATFEGRTQSSVEDISKTTELNYFLNRGESEPEETVLLPAVKEEGQRADKSAFFTQAIQAKDKDTYVLIVDEQGEPIISEWAQSLSICSNDMQGRISKYEEYIDIIEDNKTYNDLIKYSFNTLDFRTVSVQDKGYIERELSKGITICKTER